MSEQVQGVEIKGSRGERFDEILTVCSAALGLLFS